MERSIRALVAVEGLDAFDVQRALPDDPNFELIGITDGVDETVRTLQSREVDVHPRRLPGPRGRPVAPDHRRRPPRRPDVPIIVLSTSSPNGFLRRAFEAGRGRHGPLPAVEGAAALRDEQGDRARPAQGARRRRRADGRPAVCVLGPKGGTGKTLTSCNLAVALALAGQKVLVIDLDLQFGDVALCLGLPPEKTMYDLAVSGGSLDEDKLARLRDDARHRRRRPPRAGAARTRRARSRSSCSATSSSWRVGRTTS